VKLPVKKKDIKKTLGQNIALLRKEKGLSQSQLAYDAEIDISTLSRLERGNLNVTLDVLIKIALILEISVADLFE
jgi:transcriptional regulator with XRE-family HTH domain